MRPLLALLLLLLAIAPTGCVRVDYYRVSHFEPTPDTILRKLEGSGAELGDCLGALGAPLVVGEMPDGIAIAYGWQDRGNWGFDVSYAFQRFMSVRFNYRQIETSLRGVLLLFDDNLRLRAIRRGNLGDLTRRFRRRPTDPDEFDT
ncbi:MAG: hypothetical protein ACYTGW_10430 [Planctomycetota bacterium]